MGGELNTPVETIDGSGAQGARKRQGSREWIYMQVPANTPAGTPLVVTHDGDEEVMVKGVAPATLAVYQEVAVTPRLAGASAEFMWCQTKGICQVLCNGTTDIAKDDYLELLNAGTALVKDGTVRSTNSVAIACESYTGATNALTSVQLLGAPAMIAAT